MFFTNPIRRAAMAHVNKKINQASELYSKKTALHKDELRADIAHAKQLRKQKDSIALEQAISSVLDFLNLKND